MNLSCIDDLPAIANVTVSDNCGTPDLSFNEVIAGTDCGTGITYTRTWTATDACGNVSVATQVITILDDIDPVLNGVPANLNLCLSGFSSSACYGDCHR
ncbi:MAG: hypothetical protein R2784_08090 [Saprospiraceae bacterium]